MHLIPTLLNKNKICSNCNREYPENWWNYTFAMIWFSTRHSILLRHRICIDALLHRPSVLLQILVIIEWIGLGLYTHIIAMYSTYLRRVISHFGHRNLKIKVWGFFDKSFLSYIFKPCSCKQNTAHT